MHEQKGKGQKRKEQRAKGKGWRGKGKRVTRHSKGVEAIAGNEKACAEEIGGYGEGQQHRSEHRSGE